MRNKLFVFVMLIAILVLGACGGGEPQVEGCLGTADDAIVDLECREITIAIEAMKSLALADAEADR